MAIHRLKALNLIDENPAFAVLQVISLRDYAAHDLLPDIPEAILHHLFFFSCKSFKDTVEQEFPNHANFVSRNYLSISFTNITTYADQISKLLGCDHTRQNTNFVRPSALSLTCPNVPSLEPNSSRTPFLMPRMPGAGVTPLAVPGDSIGGQEN